MIKVNRNNQTRHFSSINHHRKFNILKDIFRGLLNHSIFFFYFDYFDHFDNVKVKIKIKVQNCQNDQTCQNLKNDQNDST